MRLRKNRKQQRGGVLLESLIGMCFLLFLCFALVELFMMIGRQMVMDYSSFYGAKALALGYAGENCYKATRVAASGISGKDESSAYQVPMRKSSSAVRNQLRVQASRYMSLGRGSGVEYEYWYSDGDDSPRFTWAMAPYGNSVECEMTFRNPPFLMEGMKKLLNLVSSCSCKGESPNPVGSTRMFNYAKIWMDE